jgi:hypothetical protein
MEVKMASNKIKALALTSTIAMAAVIGSTSLAEARHYCRAHYGWHRHCGGTHWGYARPVRTYWGYAARPTYWGSAYRPMRYSRCYRPGYYGYGGVGYYGSAWPTYSSYGWGGGPGYYGYGGGLLGAGLGGLGAGLGAGIGLGAGLGTGLFGGWW